MRRSDRPIPWKSISIPWIRRSKGWIFRSKACFRREIRGEKRHIVAKITFPGVPAAGRRGDIPENEAFLIFAHLRASERARENNRFSVLKTCAADKGEGDLAAWEIRHVETRFIASLTARMASVRRDREARAPIGGELSITAGEPKANLRKGSIRICGPHGGPTLITAGRPQAHPRSSEAAERPKVSAEKPAVRTTSA